MPNDLIPFKEPADRVTCTATAAVTGKRFVAISGDRQADGTYSVAPAGAGAKVFGVAAFDAAAGRKVTVIAVDSSHIVPVTAGAALAANASVASDAAGAAVAVAGAAGAVVHAQGIALTGAAAGADAQILLTRHSVTV
jgi:hypothetical protein